MSQGRTQNIIFFDAMSTVLICFIMLSATIRPSAAPQKNETRITLMAGSDAKCRGNLGIAIIQQDGSIRRESDLQRDNLISQVGATKLLDQDALAGQRGILVFLKDGGGFSSLECLDRRYLVSVVSGASAPEQVELTAQHRYTREVKHVS